MPAHEDSARFLWIAVGAAVLALGAGLSFALWSKHGVGIFRAMAEAGVAWCF